MSGKLHKRTIKPGNGRGRESYTQYSLTVPAGLATQLDPDAKYEPELTTDGDVLFRRRRPEPKGGMTALLAKVRHGQRLTPDEHDWLRRLPGVQLTYEQRADPRGVVVQSIVFRHGSDVTR